MHIKIICTGPVEEYEIPEVEMEEEGDVFPVVKPSKEIQFLVNADCPVGLFNEYIRKKAGLPTNAEFDLADSNGTTLHLNKAPCLNRATEFVQLKQTYYILKMIPSSSDSLTSKPSLLLPKGTKTYSDLLLRIKKNIAGSQTSIKSRTKSGSKTSTSTGRRSLVSRSAK